MKVDEEDSGQDSKNKLTIDTRINIAHIFTTIIMVVAIFSGWTDVKMIIATNTAEIANIKTERSRDAAELRDSVRELNLKVDRLIERSHPQLSYKSYDNK